MAVTTFEAVVDKGQIRLPKDVLLPENTPVYVIVPNVVGAVAARVASPRLAHRHEAADFKKEVVPGDVGC